MMRGHTEAGEVALFVGDAQKLSPLFLDPQVTDILINGHETIFYEKKGVSHRWPSPFQSATSLAQWVERIMTPLGKSLHHEFPFLDGQLADGTRFHIAFPPSSQSGICLSFRKFHTHSKLKISDFIAPPWEGWIKNCLVQGDNILISGATGSGKTSLLTAMLSLLPCSERLVLIEEQPELRVDHPHQVHLVLPQSSFHPTSFQLSLADLVRQSLRMRPDRIIVGECRGKEALHWIMAMHTGHRGGMTTIHARSAVDSLYRLETLLLTQSLSVPLGAIRRWISRALQHIVFVEKDGESRQVSEIISLSGMEGENYRIHPQWKRA